MGLVISELWDESEIYPVKGTVRNPSRDYESSNKKYVDKRRKVFTSWIKFDQAANTTRYYFPEGKPTKKELGVDEIEYVYIPYKVRWRKLCIAFPDYYDLHDNFAGSIQIGIAGINEIDNSGGDVLGIEGILSITVDNANQLKDTMYDYLETHQSITTTGQQYMGYVIFITTSATFPVIRVPRILVTFEYEEIEKN